MCSVSTKLRTRRNSAGVPTSYASVILWALKIESLYAVQIFPRCMQKPLVGSFIHEVRFTQQSVHDSTHIFSVVDSYLLLIRCSRRSYCSASCLARTSQGKPRSSKEVGWTCSRVLWRKCGAPYETLAGASTRWVRAE